MSGWRMEQGSVWRRQAGWFVVLPAMWALAFAFRAFEGTGDPDIYMMFYRHFFELPFSSYPGMVNYGTTSPLWAFVGAVVYHWFPADVWAYALRTLSFTLAGVAMMLVVRQFPRLQAPPVQLAAVVLLLAVFVTNPLMLSNIAFLYEIPLVLCYLAALWACAASGRWRAAILLNGSLYLVRPELAVLSVLLAGYFFCRAEDRRRALGWIALAYLPCVLYTAYMGVMTQTWIPTSAAGRTITALEKGDMPYLAAFWISCKGFLRPYLLGNVAVVLAVFLRLRRPRAAQAVHTEAPPAGFTCLFAAGLVLPFVLVPPMGYAARYLAPFLVAQFIAAADVVASLSMEPRAGRWMTRVAAAALVVLVAAGAVRLWRTPQFAFVPGNKPSTEVVLGKDLADQLNPMLTPGDRVLVYEIQMQYYLDAPCISLDGIVGRSEMLPFLRHEEKLADAMRRHGVTYLVTMESFNYRPIYRDTDLVAVYNHDRASAVGDRFSLHGVTYTKVLTNPSFADPARYELVPLARVGLTRMNNGDTVAKVQAADAEHYPHCWPMWDSVYRVSFDSDE